MPGCSVGVGLLFLPAAGLLNGQKLTQEQAVYRSLLRQKNEAHHVFFRSGAMLPGGNGFGGFYGGAVRLASRSGLSVVVSLLSLLFLPAGGKDEYWSRTGWVPRPTGLMTAIGIFVRQHRVAGIDSRDRRNLASIRLASRSGLFGCSVVFGLLFLPAAERIWSSSAGLAFSNGGVSAIRLNVALPMSGELRDRRYKLFSLRLASRSGLFGCSGVGLLFLPAAGQYLVEPSKSNQWARYWSCTSAANTQDGATGWLIMAASNDWGVPIRFPRLRGLGIRLASRSELFGCSVGGVESSVPARCPPRLVDIRGLPSVG